MRPPSPRPAHLLIVIVVLCLVTVPGAAAKGPPVHAGPPDEGGHGGPSDDPGRPAHSGGHDAIGTQEERSSPPSREDRSPRAEPAPRGGQAPAGDAPYDEPPAQGDKTYQDEASQNQASGTPATRGPQESDSGEDENAVQPIPRTPSQEAAPEGPTTTPEADETPQASADQAPETPASQGSDRSGASDVSAKAGGSAQPLDTAEADQARERESRETDRPEPLLGSGATLPGALEPSSADRQTAPSHMIDDASAPLASLLWVLPAIVVGAIGARLVREPNPRPRRSDAMAQPPAPDAGMANEPGAVTDREPGDLPAGAAGKPPGARGVLLLGQEALEAGEIEDAIAWFETTIALQPRSSIAHLCMGLCLQELDRLEEAEEALRHAQDLDPNDPVAPLYRGVVLAHLGQAHEAVEVLAPLVREHRAIVEEMLDDDEIAPLHDDPRWLSLLGEL